MLESQEARWLDKHAALNVQLNEEKALRKSNVDDLDQKPSIGTHCYHEQKITREIAIKKSVRRVRQGATTLI